MKGIVNIGLLILMLSGCSSIVSKSDYSVAISTNPALANFVITDQDGREVHSGITPETIVLKSSSGFFSGATYKIKFVKEGYSDKVYTLNSSIDGWYFGNILFGGLIGMLVVDPATGAMYNLPERVDLSLDQPVSQKMHNQLSIALIDDLSDVQKLKLRKIN